LDRAREYRDVLGLYPTGVALVTLLHEGSARAMTINSFASVSLEPPLILWSVAKDSMRYRLFRDAPSFAINVLASDQESLATACAQSDDLEEGGASWELGEGGAPLVAGAVARLECIRETVHPAGDHDIIIGRVTGFDRPRRSAALVFHRSAYASAGGAV
jgi:flavin reductase (DIM6/NTAB) family NADH-FMN oxidoreductase RutF